LLHVLATFFVFKLARRLSQRDDISLLTAIIFGLHPAHIEAVAWVSGATESLFTVLLIASFLCFLDWREGKAHARICSLLLYALAILSKETAVVMMPLVFTYAWIYPKHERPSVAQRLWNSVVPALPFLAITFAYLYLRHLALHGFYHPAHPLDARTNLLTIPSVLWFYLKMLVAPVGVSAFYDTPYVTSFSLQKFWLPLFAVALAASALFYWWRRTRNRLLVIASALLVLPLLPLMNLGVFSEGDIAHARYLYVPSIGFAILASLLLIKASTRVRLVLVAAITFTFLSLTVWQSLYWANNLVLYKRGVDIAPDNNVALNNLANEFVRRKMYPQATAMFYKILARNPNFYFANYNLGYVLFKSGDCDHAGRFLRRAAALVPTDAETFYYIGQCEMKLQHIENAEAMFHQSIRTDPRLLGPRFALGELYRQQGRTKDALDYFRAELAKNPNDLNARSAVEALTTK
jgi:tetratricopeptide (TPR) repeat protein